MHPTRQRLPKGSRSVQPGVLLLGRAWPARAYLYASLREAGVDVYGIEDPVEAAVALSRWPRRFGLLVMDAARYSRSEVAAALGLCARARVPALMLCGVFEESSLPAPLPADVSVLRKPVAVGRVVEAVGTRLSPP